MKNVKEVFFANGGDLFSKGFIVSFIFAALNSILFGIGFGIQDNKREIQQPFIMTQIVISGCLILLFFTMFIMERNHLLNKYLYLPLFFLNIANFSILIKFFQLNSQNNEKDKDTKRRTTLYWFSYCFNIIIFGFSIFLCTKMIFARDYKKC